jgi:hypothetical protein
MMRVGIKIYQLRISAMRWLIRFRDVLWLAVVLVLAVGGWADRQRTASQLTVTTQQLESLKIGAESKDALVSKLLTLHAQFVKQQEPPFGPAEPLDSMPIMHGPEKYQSIPHLSK